MLVELKNPIEANPLFGEELQFPNLTRLRTVINQSLNWQHQLYRIPRLDPDIKTLFVDHSCALPNGARVPPAKDLCQKQGALSGFNLQQRQFLPLFLVGCLILL